MRLTAPLDDVLVTRSHLRVLRALDALPVGVPASGRQLARRAGISHTAASRALSGLADEGVVLARPYGRADYYELNREHVLYEGLRALFKRETGLKNDLIEFGSSDQRRLAKALKLLDGDDRHPSLRVHELSGDLTGVWSASASDDLRIEFVRLGGGGKLLLRCSRHYAR